MTAKFLLYSRWNRQIGEIQPISASWRAEINSEDELTMELHGPLSKGDRILWRDVGGRWREHVVDSETQEHSDGESFDARAIWALQADLSRAHVRQWVARDVTCQQALSTVLEQTTWRVGTVEGEGTADFDFLRMSVYECVLEIAGAFNLEIEQVLSLDGTGVASRSVSLLKQRGRDYGARFDYGHDLAGVSKEVLDTEVITACYGYGASLDSKTDGQQDRLWVLVEDNEAKQTWGVPGPDGSPMHAYGSFEDSEIEDGDELKKAAADYLAKHNRPEVSYTTDIPFACLKGVGLGDHVHVVDRDFTPELRLDARVGGIDADALTGEATSCTFGTVVSVLPDVLSRTYQVAASAAKSAEASVMATDPSTIMAGFNGLYEKGGSYVAQTPAGGIITANVPLDSQGRPTSTTGTLSAIQFSGGKLRTATTVDSSGNWQWKDAVLTTA